MSEFLLYLRLGIEHVLDLKAYDHILFFAALILPFSLKQWKKIVLLVSIFTLGHTLSLILAVYKIKPISSDWVEFLIIISILITALIALLSAGKNNSSHNNTKWHLPLITFLFGLIHGFGFSNYLLTLLPNSTSEKVLYALEFALGVELAQLLVVLIVMALAFLIQNILRYSKKETTLILSSIIIGMVIPLLIETPIFKLLSK